MSEPVQRIEQIPEKHLQKMAISKQATDEALAAAQAAKAVAVEKVNVARCAHTAQAFVYELVYELIGAPQNAEVEVDLQAGVVRWLEAPQAAST